MAQQATGGSASAGCGGRWQGFQRPFKILQRLLHLCGRHLHRAGLVHETDGNAAARADHGDPRYDFSQDFPHRVPTPQAGHVPVMPHEVETGALHLCLTSRRAIEGVMSLVTGRYAPFHMLAADSAFVLISSDG
jgi:hypothetical protein